MPYLVQVLLPVYDNDGDRFPTDHYDEVRGKLTDVFGGLTAYTRAPAEGLWNSAGTVKRDDIVVVGLLRSWRNRSIVHFGRTIAANSKRSFTKMRSLSAPKNKRRFEHL